MDRFIKRYLLHIMPGRFVQSRAFGILKSKGKMEEMRRTVGREAAADEGKGMRMKRRCVVCNDGHYLSYRICRPGAISLKP